MFVITVIPLQRGTTVTSLSYYASVAYKPGSVLSVPLRNQTIKAVATECKPVSAAKTALKAATFSLRKLGTQSDVAILPRSLINTALQLQQTVPASLGAILFALLPPDVRSGERDYPQTPEAIGTEESTPTIFTGRKHDRYLTYKSHIRETFAHRGSVLFIVPNSVAVSYAKELLDQGIEKRVITFSSTHTKKQLNSSYEAFVDLSSAKLIIATPSFAFLDRHDLTSIIIEESGSGHYVNRTRPYLDSRDVLKVYATIARKSILLGDHLPATEDEYHRREEFYTTREEHPNRLAFTTSFSIAEHKQTEGEKNFKLFTEQLIKTIEVALSNKGRIFLFAARKGLAPLVLCYDCGYIFRCPDSGAPFSLLRVGEGDTETRWFVCSTSGRKQRASDTCPDCGSWRLREQGVGIQQVEDQAKKQFPHATIIRFDHQTASTHRKAKKLADTFYQDKAVILIGTAMTLPYLIKPVDVTAVTSYEALRANPTWRAEEATLSLLLSLREVTTKDCIVQVRSEADHILKIANSGRIDTFYDDELSMRAALKYPPFSKLLLLSYTGTKTQLLTVDEQINSLLKPYTYQTYNTPSVSSTQFLRHTLIRVPCSTWPDEQLINLLRTLPPNIKIEIGPQRII